MKYTALAFQLFFFVSCYHVFADEAYVIKKRIEIPELQAKLTCARHVQSGLEVVHVHTPHDSENFFCIALRTLPESSNGVAHILEHVVLEGSKKFPSRGLFTCLKNRSFATYLNAFTTADATCYVAASTIPKDFYNIFEIYLDAVFCPLITPYAFAQEGFRKEIADNGMVEYKGVVYNEMKGALASPQARLRRKVYEELFPSTLYRFESGGDPDSIPEVSHEELLLFHKTYYQPSNCTIFLYGDIPFEQHEEFLKTALPKVDAEKDRYSPPLQEPLIAPCRKDYGEKEACTVGFGWCTAPMQNSMEVAALSLIDTILMESDNGLVKQQLLASGLCAEAYTSLDTWKMQTPYLLFADGCKKSTVDRLEHLLVELLKTIVREGIPQNCIKNALQMHEVRFSETRNREEPYGMTLFERAGWVHMAGGSVEKALAAKEMLQMLALRIKEESHYLEKIIDRYLISNPHFVRISLDPKVPMSFATPVLDSEEKIDVIEMQKKLRELQEQVVDDSPIPSISLEEINVRKKEPFQRCVVDGREVLYLPSFTNGITYVDCIFELPQIEELWIAQLFCQLAPELGIAGRSWQDTLQYVHEHTAGVDVVPFVCTNGAGVSLYLSFSSKALKREKLLEILSSMARDLDFSDKARIVECIKKIATGMKSSFEGHALSYTLVASSAYASPHGRVSHAWHGLDYYAKIQGLVSSLTSSDQEVDSVCAKLQKFYQGLVEKAVIVVSDDTEYMKSSISVSETLSSKKYEVILPEKKSRIVEEIAAPVAFNAVGFMTIPFLHQESAALSIAAALMSNILHISVREQGGAYGARASYDFSSGHFLFYSYRDPRRERTFQAFEEAIQEVLQGTVSSRDLEEAKLKVLQKVYAPVPAAFLGLKHFKEMIEGKTDQAMDAFRKSIAQCDRESMREAVKKYIFEQYHQGSFVTLAGRTCI